MKKLPIGLQNLREMRTQGYAYVDKTHFVAQLAEQGKYYFLARPRRFGKSLFVDTLGGLRRQSGVVRGTVPVIH